MARSGKRWIALSSAWRQRFLEWQGPNEPDYGPPAREALGTLRCLFGASAGKDDGNGAKKDFKVEPKRPVVDVFEVEAHPIPEIADFVAAADLPKAREARLDAQATAMGGVIEALDLIDWKRPRADEGHFAAKDVKDLWKFIDAPFAEPPANGSDAGIVGEFEDRPAHFVEGLEFDLALFGVADHGAEFEHDEGTAIEATAALPEKDWARRSEFDGKSGGGQDPP